MPYFKTLTVLNLFIVNVLIDNPYIHYIWTPLSRLKSMGMKLAVKDISMKRVRENQKCQVLMHFLWLQRYILKKFKIYNEASLKLKKDWQLTQYKNQTRISNNKVQKRRKKYNVGSTLTKSEPHRVEDTLNASQLSYNCQLWATKCCLSNKSQRTPRTLISSHSWCCSPPTSLWEQAQNVQAGTNSEHATRRTFNTGRPESLNYHSVHELFRLEPVAFHRKTEDMFCDLRGLSPQPKIESLE